MAVQQVRNIAPFINDEFTITSKWWTERVNPVTGQTEIHRGLDISTSGISKPVYSILNGIVHSKGTHESMGNWIIIKDNNPSSITYGYATLYMHLNALPLFTIGQRVEKGTYIEMEGRTGTATGVHLHVEMQDLNRWGNVWHWSYVKEDYIDPTEYMGIDNVVGTQWIYDGTPIEITTIKKRFLWVIYNAKKRRDLRLLQK